MAQNENLTRGINVPEGMGQIVNSVRLSPWDYEFVRPANELVDKICRRDEHFCNTVNDFAVALYDAGMTREQLQDYRDSVRGLLQSNIQEGNGQEALESYVAEFEAMNGQIDGGGEMTLVDKAVSICLPEDVLEKGEYFSRNKEYRGVVERILPELLAGYDREDLNDFAAYLYSSGLTESQLPDARGYVLRWYGGDFYLDSGLDKTVRDMIPDNVIETGRSVYVEREQERIQNGVYDGRYKEFSKELLGIARDLAIEFTVGGDRFDRDYIALALYDAGLKAEQLPAFREYVRNLPQCEFPDKEDLEYLRIQVGEFEYSEPINGYPSEADYAENNRHKREIEKLEVAEAEHEEFIENQLKTWLPDNVVETGKVLRNLIEKDPDRLIPFAYVTYVGKNLWAGSDIVFEDLGSTIMLDGNGNSLHEGDIFTHFEYGKMVPGYSIDDNGVLSAVTGHIDDNGKIVSDGLFVADIKAGQSLWLDCGQELRDALELADKHGLLHEFVSSACNYLLSEQGLSKGEVIKAGLREYDICPDSEDKDTSEAISLERLKDSFSRNEKDIAARLSADAVSVREKDNMKNDPVQKLECRTRTGQSTCKLRTARKSRKVN